MKCSDWQIEISAHLDGSLKADEWTAVEEHLNSCSDCAAFREEQLELDRAFCSELPDLEPPSRVWHRIETQLDSQSKPRFWNFSQFFRMPRLGYAGAVLVLLLAFGLFLSNSPDLAENEIRYLAELEIFQIEVRGNPFLQDIQAENPFMKLGQYETGNPFDRLGGSQQ